MNSMPDLYALAFWKQQHIVTLEILLQYGVKVTLTWRQSQVVIIQVVIIQDQTSAGGHQDQPAGARESSGTQRQLKTSDFFQGRTVW